MIVVMGSSTLLAVFSDYRSFILMGSPHGLSICAQRVGQSTVSLGLGTVSPQLGR